MYYVYMPIRLPLITNNRHIVVPSVLSSVVTGHTLVGPLLSLSDGGYYVCLRCGNDRAIKQPLQREKDIINYSEDSVENVKESSKAQHLKDFI